MSDGVSWRWNVVYVYGWGMISDIRSELFEDNVFDANWW